MANKLHNQGLEIRNTARNIVQDANRRRGARQSRKGGYRQRSKRNNNNRRGRNRGRKRNNNSRKERVMDILAGTHTYHYMESVVDPFSQAAVGAFCPDSFSKQSITACDRFDLSFNPANWDGNLYQYQGTTPTIIPTYIAGVAFVILPRCIATGWVNGKQEIGDSVPYTDVQVRQTYYDQNAAIQAIDDWSPDIRSSSLAIQDPYCILMMPVTNNGYVVRTPYAQELLESGQLGLGPSFMKFARMNPLLSNVEDLRILGAGLKINPSAAPIITGGQVFGGTIKPEEIYTLLDAQTTKNVTTTGPFLELERKMKNRVQYVGIKGCTARYSPFSDPTQMEYRMAGLNKYWPELYQLKPPADQSRKKRKINSDVASQCSNYQYVAARNSRVYESKNEFDDDGDLDMKDVYNTTKITKLMNQSSVPFVIGNTQMDLSVYDLARPEDPVPIIFYKYDTQVTTNEMGNTTIAGRYNVQVRSRVHTQGHSYGDSPFILEDIEADPACKLMQDYISNTSNYPIATMGNSFKSVFSKLGKMAAHVAKGASKFQKILSIIEH